MRLPGFGLSVWGTKQAGALAKHFAKLNISSIYASPLQRTKETARIIANGKLQVRYADELLEANYKKWQGLKHKDRDPKEVEGYLKDPVRYSAALGESLVDIQKRVVGKLFEIVEKHQEEEIIVVTHAAPAITARLYFENRPLDDYQKCLVNFGSVTMITFDDELKCNEVSYHEYVKQRTNR
jgi:broad specificity phosphatase PhoE